MCEQLFSPLGLLAAKLLGKLEFALEFSKLLFLLAVSIAGAHSSFSPTHTHNEARQCRRSQSSAA